MASSNCSEYAYASVLDDAVEGCGRIGVAFTLLLPERLFEETMSTNSSSGTDTTTSGGRRRLQSVEDYSELLSLVRGALLEVFTGVTPEEVLLAADRATLTVDVAILEGTIDLHTIMAIASSDSFLASLSAGLGVSVSFAKPPRVVVGDFANLQAGSSAELSVVARQTTDSGASVGAAIAVVVSVILLVPLAVYVPMRLKRNGKRNVICARCCPCLTTKLRRTAPAPPASERDKQEWLDDPTYLAVVTAVSHDPALALQPGWSVHWAQDGAPYYHNEETGESLWSPPLAQTPSHEAEMMMHLEHVQAGNGIAHDHAEALILQPGWEEHWTQDGTPYYHNDETGESRWTPPLSVGVPPPSSSEPAVSETIDMEAASMDAGPMESSLDADSIDAAAMNAAAIEAAGRDDVETAVIGTAAAQQLQKKMEAMRSKQALFSRQSTWTPHLAKPVRQAPVLALADAPSPSQIPSISHPSGLSYSPGLSSPRLPPISPAPHSWSSRQETLWRTLEICGLLAPEEEEVEVEELEEEDAESDTSDIWY